MQSGKAQNKRCEKWFFRFFCDGQESVANSIAQQSRNQKTPLFPPFARGDTRGVKKLSKTCLHENRERKFLHSNSISGRLQVALR